MSSQSPSNSSTPTDQSAQGIDPAAAFGPNEWLVDEIYQQYLQDPNSVDRAWWDFFADYKPGAKNTAAPGAESEGTPPAAPAAPVTPQAATPAPRAATNGAGPATPPAAPVPPADAPVAPPVAPAPAPVVAAPA
ncbi:2-oxoglutarate dehydrogenase E1 subunit family protein, partial [Streptomyces amakusaensis]|uniref:2-oxoglutarate dehydrogenase E1 subunit family protein n=1 Tax=Streptomyces amakusaensis TaxID=67271 RepID=UPI003CD05572